MILFVLLSGWGFFLIFFLREGAICLGFCFILGKAIKHSHIPSTHTEGEVVSLNRASGTHCFHLRGSHRHPTFSLQKKSTQQRLEFCKNQSYLNKTKEQEGEWERSCVTSALITPEATSCMQH